MRRFSQSFEEREEKDDWRLARRIGYAISCIVAAAILTTTPYTVHPTDRAIVQRFGGYQRTEAPGFNSQLPWPFESRHIIPTQKIRRLELGYRTIGIDPQTGRPLYENHPEEVTMMTKDENLAIVEFSLQYDIKDPFAYSFNVKDPDKTLHDISQAAMRRIVAQEEIDSVLLTGKPEIQITSKEEIQSIADSYGMGIRVLVVQLGDVRAPPEVKSAFDDVQRAAENREETINQGRTYANMVVPEAIGEAYRMIQEARAYESRVTNEATGDADRFLKILQKYKEEPGITRRQLYLQEMRSILGKFQKTIIDKDIPINIFMEGEDR